VTIDIAPTFNMFSDFTTIDIVMMTDENVSTQKFEPRNLYKFEILLTFEIMSIFA
jgi:hypothetical protein